MIGGSNFGEVRYVLYPVHLWPNSLVFIELLGALAVLVLSDYVPTPLPWLRLDALAVGFACPITSNIMKLNSLA